MTRLLIAFSCGATLVLGVFVARDAWRALLRAIWEESR